MKPVKENYPLSCFRIVLFLILITFVSLSSQAFAAHPENVPPRTTMCNPIPNTGAHNYSVFIGCWFRVVRPLGDTGGPPSGRPPLPLQIGLHYPLQFPGVSSIVAPHYHCFRSDINGHGRVLCNGNTPENGFTQVDFNMHVVGACGTQQRINVVVSNPTGAVAGPLWETIQFPACPTPPPPPSTCSDGLDNDGDTFTDFPADPGCSSPQDNSETNPDIECDNGRDDDGDNVVDFPRDPGCNHPSDTSERDPHGPACDNGIDDDGDGLADFPADPGCSGPTDNDERDPNGPECDNGRDDDADGQADFPLDSGCDSPQDPSERTPTAECDDGLDNDHDGVIDFPSDPGCSSPTDTSERDPHGPECDDGRDNDGDGRSDFPQDSGCDSPADPSERGQSACDNGVDDDADGLIDFPMDAGCHSPEDDSERDPDGPACDNGRDDDSDELIDYPTDPGCLTPEDDSEDNCQQGQQESRHCQTSLPGACASGEEVRVCEDDFQFGDFGACEPLIEPGSQQEICNDNLDNDCDSKIDAQDPDCRVCDTGVVETRSCDSGLPGSCGNGWQSRVCNAEGQWGDYSSCEAEVNPGEQSEVCSDGIDNDCDGKTDLQDSDCFDCQPGTVDTSSCNSGLSGVCTAGEKQRVCNDSGQWSEFSSCQALIQPGESPEACDDGIDNDCDGATDAADGDCLECQPGAYEKEPCDSGLLGLCGAGHRTRICNWTGQWGPYGACDADQEPGGQAENCFDEKDNDCDGAVDLEDSDCVVCTPGEVEERSCDTGWQGVCAAGVKQRSCLDSGQWGPFTGCQEQVLPGEQHEICDDGLDNDCDGLRDTADDDCGSVCTEVDTYDTRRLLLGNLLRLHSRGLWLSRHCGFQTHRRYRYRRYVSSSHRTELYQLTRKGKQLIWQLPRNITSCDGESSGCGEPGLAEISQEIAATLDEILAVAEEIAAGEENTASSYRSRRIGAVLEQTRNLVEESLLALDDLPDASLNCQ